METETRSEICETSVLNWNVGSSDLTWTNWTMMRLVLRQLTHHSLNRLGNLFSEFYLTAKSIRISATNGHCAQNVLIGTNVSHYKEAEDTGLERQGYFYEEQPDDFPGRIFTTKTDESGKFFFVGYVASDFFSCD